MGEERGCGKKRLRGHNWFISSDSVNNGRIHCEGSRLVARVETADLSLSHLAALVLHCFHLTLVLALVQKVPVAWDVQLGEERGGKEQQTPHPQLLSGLCSQLKISGYLRDLYRPGVRKEGRKENAIG